MKDDSAQAQQKYHNALLWTCAIIVIGILLYVLESHLEGVSRKPKATDSHSTPSNTVRDFEVFVPSYLEDLVIARNWFVTESPYTQLSIIYHSQNNEGGAPVEVRITERKSRQQDQTFLQEEQKEDQDFMYQRIAVGKAQALVVIPKYSLPIQTVSYDPTATLRLILIKNGTFIEIYVTDRAKFTLPEVIKVAESLKPQQ
jgi:hypothetical protein